MRLKGYAAVNGVLKEQTTVDLTLVEVGSLVARVDNVGCASRLLQDTELELAAACEVDSRRAGNASEL